MPNPNVTMRHTRHAIRLVLCGAIHDIEAEFAAGQDNVQQAAAIVRLFDEVVEEIGNWEIPGAWVTKAEGMIEDMRERLGAGEYPNDIGEVLTKFDLLP